MRILTHRPALPRIALLAMLAAGCELDPVSIADGDDRLVVEAVLRAGEPVQTVLLHRTYRGSAPRTEPGARITVTGNGREIEFEEVDAASCVMDASLRDQVSCYRSPDSAGSWVLPGAVYDLSLRTTRGEQATGRTTVPGVFTLHVAGGSAPGQGPPLCRIEPDRTHRIGWSQSPGASTYALELQVQGMGAALREEGHAAPRDSVILVALHGAARDTTTELPKNFFIGREDWNDTQTDLLRRLQTGLPRGSRGTLVIAAIDHNLAKSVRVAINSIVDYRASSVTGDARGVFGSLVGLPLEIEVGGTGMSCGAGSQP